MDRSLHPPLLQNPACAFSRTRLLSHVPVVISTLPVVRTTGRACDLGFGASPSWGIAPSRYRVGLALLSITPSDHVHMTARTSAYPRRYPRPWLLAGSSPTRHLVGTYSRHMRARVGFLRSQLPLLASVGRCSPPGFCGSAGRSVRTAAGALSCAVLAPAHQPLALDKSDDGSSTPSLALPIDAC
jgi:hypothetical protein